jgi:hypothetical protein
MDQEKLIECAIYLLHGSSNFWAPKILFHVSMLMDVVCLDNTLIRTADTVLQYFIQPLAMHWCIAQGVLFVVYLVGLFGLSSNSRFTTGSWRSSQVLHRRCMCPSRCCWCHSAGYSSWAKDLWSSNHLLVRECWMNPPIGCSSCSWPCQTLPLGSVHCPFVWTFEWR